MGKKKTSLIVSENGKNEQIAVDAAAPVHVKAQPGISYLLHTEDGTAPQNVTVKRVGDDLEVTLEGDDAPALILDGFFTQPESVKLYGIGEDGLLHDYARTDGDLGGIFSLADSESQPVALGTDTYGAGAPYLVMDPGGNNYGALGLLGLLGALGLGAAAYAHDRDGNGDNNPLPAPDTLPPAPSSNNEAVDDVGPIIGPIAPGGITDDANPTFSGGAEPGATVVIIDNGQEIGSTTVNPDGSWDFTPDVPLPDGKHEIIPKVIDPAGNETPSDPIVIVVDTTAPSAPNIAQVTDNVGNLTGPLANGDVTDDSTPASTGTAEAGSVVTIYDNGSDVPLGSVTADADGNWSFTPPELSEGKHEFTATSTDAAGNTSGPSAPFDVITDYTPPDASKLAITGVLDDIGSVTGNVASGGSTDDATPLIKGTGTAGDTILVMDKTPAGASIELGRATVGADGTWSLQVDSALSAGTNTFTAVEMDAAGNKAASADYAIVVAGAAPQPPVINTVQDDVGEVHFMQKGEVTNDAMPQVKGTAEKGTTVHLYEGSADGQELGTALVDENGQWSFTPAAALAEGAHNLVAVAVDAVGQQSDPTGVWPFTVDTTAPTPTDAIATDDQGAETGPIVPGSTTDDSTPTFSGGGAEPGDTVVITDGGKEIGSTTVKPDGTWDVTPSDKLPDGPHEFTPTFVDPAGNTTPGDSISFTVDTTEVPVAIESVSDDMAPIKGNVTPNGVTDDTTPSINGTAKPGALVTVMDGQTPVGSATADANGNWSITPEQPLAEGAHSVTAHAVDPAGNPSDSTPFGFTVDTGAPAAPTIDGATDDVGAVTDPLTSGDVTDDPSPTFNGKAEPDSVVTVYEKGNDQPLGSVTTQPDGSWSFTPTVPLSEGEHEITATSTDAAGNTSGPSAPFDVITDYTAPTSAVAITSITDDTGLASDDFITSDTSLTINGTLDKALDAGDRVQISSDGGKTWADASVTDLNWTFEDPRTLPEGEQTYQVRVVDLAGNLGAIDEKMVAIDTTAPDTANEILITGITDDTGTAGDFITSDTTLTINGTLTNALGVDERVQISSDGGTTWAQADVTGTTWSLVDPQTLAEGVHTYQARVVDLAGNVGDTDEKVVTIDTTAPDTANEILITGITDDTGTTGDFITSDTTLTINGTLTNALGADERVQISSDGGTTWAQADVTGTTWSLVDPQTLAEGVHTYQARVVDLAGNVGDTDEKMVTIDTTASEVKILQAIDDYDQPTPTNVVDGGTTDDHTPTIKGTGTPGDVFTVYDQGPDGARVELGRGTVAADGTWMMPVFPDAALESGTHIFTYEEFDAAGINASADYMITIEGGALVTINATDLYVHEAALANGTGQDWLKSDGSITTDTAASGSFHIAESVSSASITLGGVDTGLTLSELLTSPSVPVGEDTLSITSLGNGDYTYSYELNAPKTQDTSAGGVGEVSANDLQITVSNGVIESTGTGAIQIVNDQPTAVSPAELTIALEDAPKAVNLVLMMDNTTSMDVTDPGATVTRLEAQSDAVQALLTKYEQTYPADTAFNITIVPFLGYEEGKVFHSFQDARYFVETDPTRLDPANPDAKPFMTYEDASIPNLFENSVMAIQAQMNESPDAVQKVYYLTDGTGNYSDTLKQVWTDFISGPNQDLLEVYGVGIGPGATSPTEEAAIRKALVTNDPTDRFIPVTNVDDLPDSLVDTVGGSKGNLLNGTDDTGANLNAAGQDVALLPGADGGVTITQMTVDGVVYAVNATGTTSVQVSPDLSLIVDKEGNFEVVTKFTTTDTTANVTVEVQDADGDEFSFVRELHFVGNAAEPTTVDLRANFQDEAVRDLGAGSFVTADGIKFELFAPQASTDPKIGQGIVSQDSLDSNDPNNVYLFNTLSGQETAAQGEKLLQIYAPQENTGEALRVSLPEGQEARSITFDMGDDTDLATAHLNFYDSEGVLVHTANPQTVTYTHVIERLHIEMPDGMTFATMTVTNAANDNLVFDNFLFEDIRSVGTSGADSFSVSEDAFGVLDGKGGIDSLVFDGTGQNVDLRLVDAHVLNVENFDLGSGNNTLTMNATNALENGVQDSASATTQLLVSGTNGELDLASNGTDDSWAASNSVNLGGVDYNIYTNASANVELLVEDKVSVVIL